jgi:hypothetical protein
LYHREYNVQEYFLAMVPPEKNFNNYNVTAKLIQLESEGDSAGIAQVLKAQVRVSAELKNRLKYGCFKYHT